MNLKFSGRGLAFLAHFMATNDIRYYLNGVCFQPLPADAGGGVIGAATNGHILGVWYDREAVCARLVIASITRPLVTACRKPGTQLEAVDGRLAAIRYEEIGGQQTRIEEMCVQPNGPRTARGDVPAWAIEGNFPDLMRVVQERDHYREGPLGEFGAQYLGLATKALDAAKTREQRRYDTGIKMRQHDKSGSMLMLAPFMPEALVIVMPRRGDDGPGAPWLERWRRHGENRQRVAAAPLPALPSDASPPPDFVPVQIAPMSAR